MNVVRVANLPALLYDATLDPFLPRTGTDLAPIKRDKKKKRVTETRPIFCEILDTRTQKLLQAHPKLGQSCNFFVSNRLMSKVLAMVAEDRKVSATTPHVCRNIPAYRAIPAPPPHPARRMAFKRCA